jgi:pSer/pThr/pTyr-binding forkhead associated (FHA) protein
MSRKEEEAPAAPPEANPAAAPETGGWPLEHFRTARTMPLPERRRVYGDAFLASLGGALRRPLAPGKTASPIAVETMEASGEPSTALISEVWPILRSGRSYFPHVTVGRVANNDIVVPDTSVSKFHAFFKVEGDRYFLADAGSRNGTRLNSMQVPAQGKGRPVELVGGVRLGFGSVELMFLLGPQFWSILETIYGE